jgi:hypothetical protein
MRERDAQVGDAIAVRAGHVRVDCHLDILALRQLRFQHILPGLEPRHPVLDRARRRAVEQRLDEVVEIAVDPVEIRLGSFPRGVVLATRSAGACSAADAHAVPHHHAATAEAAPHQAGEQVPETAAVPVAR